MFYEVSDQFVSSNKNILCKQRKIIFQDRKAQFFRICCRMLNYSRSIPDYFFIIGKADFFLSRIDGKLCFCSINISHVNELSLDRERRNNGFCCGNIFVEQRKVTLRARISIASINSFPTTLIVSFFCCLSANLSTWPVSTKFSDRFHNQWNGAAAVQHR